MASARRSKHTWTMKSRHKQLIRQRKLARLGARMRPRVLEICSGAGGLSLGMKAAGFGLSAHIELDPEAAESYAVNFGAGRSADDPWARPRDMERCSARKLVEDLALGTPPDESFDILAAGLPCQAFAR